MQAPVINISEFQADHLDTEASTAQTIKGVPGHKGMVGHIRDAVQDPEVMRAAVDSVVDQPAQSQADICRCVWTWLKRSIRFVQDDDQLRALLGREGELELLISPSVMVRPELLEQARGVREMQGDCDCFTMMGCSMLACLGIQPLIKTYKCDADSPWRWSHVCAAGLLDDGSIFPCDASHGTYAGWEVPAGAVFESCLWDMNGNKVGGSKMPRGLSGYVADPGWTGNEMTSWGRVAGPYPSQDVMTAWYPYASRKKGLGAIARGKYRGMGDCVAGFDEFGQACTDFSPITNNPTDTAAAINYLYSAPAGATLPATLPGASAPINWSSIINSLTTAGTQLGKQALLPAGAVLLPNGTVAYANQAGQNPLTASSFTQYLPMLAIVGVGILALSMLKK